MGHYSSEDVHEDLEILTVILVEEREHNTAHREAGVGPFVIINSFEEQLLKFWVLLNELSCLVVIDHKQIVELLSSGVVGTSSARDFGELSLDTSHNICKI